MFVKEMLVKSLICFYYGVLFPLQFSLVTGVVVEWSESNQTELLFNFAELQKLSVL